MEALPPEGQAAGRATFRVLTSRENDVLQLLPTSRQRSEIATALGISENTVKTHLTAIGRKLGVRGRQAIVSSARELGLLAETQPDAADAPDDT